MPRFRDFDWRWSQFVEAMDDLPADVQEQILQDALVRIRKLRSPCPCDSGKMFGECHAVIEPATGWERLGIWLGVDPKE